MAESVARAMSEQSRAVRNLTKCGCRIEYAKIRIASFASVTGDLTTARRGGKGERRCFRDTLPNQGELSFAH